MVRSHPLFIKDKQESSGNTPVYSPSPYQTPAPKTCKMEGFSNPFSGILL
jgi:hypothetical protein